MSVSVIKETKKFRILYDATAKSTGPSLNKRPYTGPSLVQYMISSDILLAITN